MDRLFLNTLEPWPEAHSMEYKYVGHSLSYCTATILLNNLINYFKIMLINYNQILKCSRLWKLLYCKRKYLILKYAMFVYTLLQLHTMWNV